MTPAELFAVAYFVWSPLLANVRTFEVNEVPNTVSLVYNYQKRNEQHIAFPLLSHDKCYTFRMPDEVGKVVISSDGVECYLFDISKPLAVGNAIKGTSRAYNVRGVWSVKKDYRWIAVGSFGGKYKYDYKDNYLGIQPPNKELVK